MGTIRQTHQGQITVDLHAWNWLYPTADPPDTPLTAREHDILQAMSQGLPNKQIAARLGVSEKTVKAHVSRILAKLRVKDRTQAVVEASRRRMIPLDTLG
ncbi:MAG: response regulator transcription factor [Thermaerobacter sp.]|nr:response regulator transcription factor [Thermaerobacter sp.]